MDASPCRWSNRPCGFLEIGPMTARETRDDRPADFCGDETNRLGIGGRRNRKTGLDDVDAERVELAGELELLRRAQREAPGLFAVTERRVGNPNACLAHVCPPPQSLPGWDLCLVLCGLCLGTLPPVLPVDATGHDNVKMIIILLRLPRFIRRGCR